MRRLTVFALALAMLAFASACAAGDNANRANANANHANANHANANAANANKANANTRGNYNANISEADYERERDRYGREAKEAGETIGSGLKDGWLWVKTKGALAAVDDLRDSTINVDVDNATITLRGSVATAPQKAQAEQTAKGIDGVTSVKNNLTVAAGGGTGGNSNNANHNAKGGSH
ncbi:MAG TPA: BON domain-containing protein [Pyrinomonadaceae bacterium]|nr:BON domain-containing protein [Pyrinomonadaceae bacterium]